MFDIFGLIAVIVLCGLYQKLWYFLKHQQEHNQRSLELLTDICDTIKKKE